VTTATFPANRFAIAKSSLVTLVKVADKVAHQRCDGLGLFHRRHVRLWGRRRENRIRLGQLPQRAANLNLDFELTYLAGDAHRRGEQGFMNAPMIFFLWRI
jgi:hypothetical protein